MRPFETAKRVNPGCCKDSTADNPTTRTVPLHRLGNLWGSIPANRIAAQSLRRRIQTSILAGDHAKAGEFPVSRLKSPPTRMREVQPNAAALDVHRLIDRSGELNFLAIGERPRRQRQPLAYILLVLWMHALLIADVDENRHRGVWNREGLKLGLANARDLPAGRGL